MMGFVVGFGALIIALREYLERSVAKKQAAAAPKKKKKTQMGVGESFAFLAKSTYIRCMATLVVCYGICINLVEVTWKSKLKVCPAPVKLISVLPRQSVFWHRERHPSCHYPCSCCYTCSFVSLGYLGRTCLPLSAYNVR